MLFVSHRRGSLLVALLLGLYIASVLMNLGTLEFSGEEPRRAMISVEMLESGNFIRPTQYGWDYYNKPPVFNWILCFIISATGSTSEFVLRLPSVFLYLLIAFIHYKISRHFFSKNIALLSSFFVLTSVDVYTYGLTYGAEIDIFYSLLVYLQAISMFWFFTKGRYAWLYVFSYLFCAIGFLTKGFPSLVFQGLTIAALCVYARSWRVVFRWQHLLGILIFIGVTGAYFLAYSRYSPPGRFIINLLNEAFLKSAVGERSARLVDKAPGYPLLFLKMLLPWSLLLLLLFRRLRYGFRTNPLVAFSLMFIAFNLWVYWFTGQPKIRYVYMFVPFSCTVLVHIYQRFTAEHAHRFNQAIKYMGWLFVLLVPALLALPVFVPVSVAWAVMLATGLAVVSFYYFRLSAARIWLFIAGFILMRLSYAALFIPIQRKGIDSYANLVAKATGGMGKQPLQYWAAARTYPDAVTTRLFSFQMGEGKRPEILPLEFSYYYYRQTGNTIAFDTLPKKGAYYISYIGQLGNKSIDTLYAWFDKNMNQRLVIYQLKK